MISNETNSLPNVDLKKNFNIRSVPGFAISGILLWLTFYKSGLHLNDLGLNSSGLKYFIAADALFIVSVWVYSVRAKLFWISANRGMKDIYTFESIALGNFYNCILPGNLGDGVRAWHFSKKNRVPFLQSLAPVFAEKWLDAQYFVLLTVVLLAVRPFVKNYVLYSIIYMAVAVMVLLVVYVFMRLNRKVEKAILIPFLFLKKTGKIFLRVYWFTAWTLAGLRKRRSVTIYFVLCASVYVLNVLQFFYLLKAAGVTGPVTSIYSAYLCAMSMMIIAFIPSAPGNIGVLHYGLYLALILSATQSGLIPGQAALQSYARFGVYVHLSYLIPETIMGVLLMVKERELMF